MAGLRRVDALSAILFHITLGFGTIYRIYYWRNRRNGKTDTTEKLINNGKDIGLRVNEQKTNNGLLIFPKEYVLGSLTVGDFIFRMVSNLNA